MKVFKFKFFFSIDSDEPQERYVLAETEYDAWQKIEAHLIWLDANHLARPVYISNPTIEVENVIV